MLLFFFFFNDTATPEIYPLSLHDALPIWGGRPAAPEGDPYVGGSDRRRVVEADRKSTRLNSSHLVISYAVFCLKKKKRVKADQLPTSPQNGDYAKLSHLMQICE